jgi:GTP-binding protein HflX
LFDRPATGERAILVNISLRGADIDDSLAEFRDLARSAGAEIVATVTGSRHAPDPALYVGTGKAEDIRGLVEANGAEIVLFNHSLTPAQERNLERQLKCRVIDRTGLILDIFAQRAHTFEGKLQVELAQLRHLSTRLIRGWTHLERQKGGIGLRGPGETQLEIDRRLIGKRIRQIRERLEKVRKQRRERRRARDRAEIATVSLVGYTNAGKSTLFNRLTGADAYVADQLFATLDPSLRRLEVPGAGHVVLSDTVGFVRDLPHDLVAAFRATLEEARDADLLLLVVDAADEQRDERLAQVRNVLAEIEADGVPCIEVFNQIDRIEGAVPHTDAGGDRVWLSAGTGAGTELLLRELAVRLHDSRTCFDLMVPAHAGRLRARLYALSAVLADEPAEGGSWHMQVRVDPHRLDQLCADAGLDKSSLISAPQDRAVAHG